MSAEAAFALAIGFALGMYFLGAGIEGLGEKIKDGMFEVAEMQKCAETETWPENPNPLCGYCDVRKCKFNRRS